MTQQFMKLKLLLPFRVFTRKDDVRRLVVETPQGAMGFLPHRLDCVAPLTPGILSYESDSEGEVFIAIDEGILVKTGTEVMVSVRNAIGGTTLGELRAAVEQEFKNLDEREQSVRSVLAKLESGFIRRLIDFQHE